MTALASGNLLRAYYAALDEPNLDRLDTILAADVQWSFPGTRLDSGEQVKRSMARSLATGLTMQHDIGHLVQHGPVAFCELVATNRVGGKEFRVPGAVVCEARQGRIIRMAAYPDGEAMRPFIAALAAQQRA